MVPISANLHAPRKIGHLKNLHFQRVKRSDFIGAISRRRYRCVFVGGLA